MTTKTNNTLNTKQSDIVIKILSVAIPIVVALLFGIRQKIDMGQWTKMLPHLNAILNSLTSLCLLAGYFVVKNKKIDLHKKLMTASFIMGSIFLISYVLYHLTNPSTPYPNEGFIKIVYYFMLISHVVLAAVVVPFVLYAMYYGITSQISKHKKIVKWTWPIWLYVSVSGVIVYVMISPYYH
ncbi:MAG: DUF420 domain-containing protein [Cytophagaceae bacterium]|nr:DUF420 domain-containing protein [Cytophagaceae bacterium]MDW8455662.1 DUF420 domain-containing protein [Cytophagaceae bacterium]